MTTQTKLSVKEIRIAHYARVNMTHFGYGDSDDTFETKKVILKSRNPQEVVNRSYAESPHPDLKGISRSIDSFTIFDREMITLSNGKTYFSAPQNSVDYKVEDGNLIGLIEGRKTPVKLRT
ncbi:MAG: hypothetical protein ACHQX1_03150 [Candidatus Micrarchaeales archaeon]